MKQNFNQPGYKGKGKSEKEEAGVRRQKSGSR